MPPRKSAKASEPAVLSLNDFRPMGFDEPDERQIDMRNDVVLTVKLAHLTTRQIKRIPMKGTLENAYKAAAQHVLDWDAQARNPQTEEVIDIPAPGDPAAVEFVKKYIGEDAEPWELFEYILDSDTGSLILMWLTNPGGMTLAEAQGKLRSGKSGSTDESLPDAATAKK